MRASSPLFALPVTLGLVLGFSVPAPASNFAAVLIEADSGKVLRAENATYPWYPASVTKLMTTYLTLRAIKEGRLTFDTLLTVSPLAAAQPPTKMGLRTGIQVTVDNALKMMLVRSANDIAVVLAEGVGGSVEKFADEMNATSQRLGMTQSNWVNPNGLPADGQVTSARDMAILARTLLREFPDYDGYFNIAAIRFGRRVIRNTNTLFMAYPGADGMKTGFICSSGFNLVATATRGDRRLIAVVLGAPSSTVRAAKAANLIEHGFNNSNLRWLMPATTVESLAAVEAAPPDLRDEMCGKRRRRPAVEDVFEEDGDGDSSNVAAMLFGSKNSDTKPMTAALEAVAARPVVDVYVGPTRPPGAVASRAANPDAAVPAVAKKRKPGTPATGLVALPERASPGAAGAKPRPVKPRPTATAAKPAAAEHDNARPGAERAASKPAPKHSASKPAADKPAPVKPAGGKPAADKPASGKTGTAKPAAAGSKPVATVKPATPVQ